VLKGATFEQVAAAVFGIATANGAWRPVAERWRGSPMKKLNLAGLAYVLR